MSSAVALAVLKELAFTVMIASIEDSSWTKSTVNASGSSGSIDCIALLILPVSPDHLISIVDSMAPGRRDYALRHRRIDR